MTMTMNLNLLSETMKRNKINNPIIYQLFRVKRKVNVRVERNETKQNKTMMDYLLGYNRELSMKTSLSNQILYKLK